MPVNLAFISDTNGKTNKTTASYPALYPTRFVYRQACKREQPVAYIDGQKPVGSSKKTSLSLYTRRLSSTSGNSTGKQLHLLMIRIYIEHVGVDFTDHSQIYMNSQVFLGMLVHV